MKMMTLLKMWQCELINTPNDIIQYSTVLQTQPAQECCKTRASFLSTKGLMPISVHQQEMVAVTSSYKIHTVRKQPLQGHMVHVSKGMSGVCCMSLVLDPPPWPQWLGLTSCVTHHHKSQNLVICVTLLWVYCKWSRKDPGYENLILDWNDKISRKIIGVSQRGLALLAWIFSPSPVDVFAMPFLPFTFKF